MRWDDGGKAGRNAVVPATFPERSAMIATEHFPATGVSRSHRERFGLPATSELRTARRGAFNTVNVGSGCSRYCPPSKLLTQVIFAEARKSETAPAASDSCGFRLPNRVRPVPRLLSHARFFLPRPHRQFGDLDGGTVVDRVRKRPSWESVRSQSRISAFGTLPFCPGPTCWSIAVEVRLWLPVEFARDSHELPHRDLQKKSGLRPNTFPRRAFLVAVAR